MQDLVQVLQGRCLDTRGGCGKCVLDGVGAAAVLCWSLGLIKGLAKA
jgi:hypothetical protein